MSLLSRITVRTLLVTAAVATIVALLAVALTQTQVGRDQIARQLEQQFENRFEGSLEIGRLSGNLVWTLYAAEVTVRDPAGRVVLSADSVVLEPHWRSLLSRELKLRQIRLYRPLIDLVHEQDAGWNLASALRSLHPRTEEPGRPLDLHAAEIRLIDGTIRTRNDGPVPAVIASGAVVDFMNASATGVDARMVVRSRRGAQRLVIRDLTAWLPGQRLGITRSRATLRANGESFAAENVFLRFGRSELVGEVVATGGAPRLSVRRARLVAEDVGRILPAIPIHDATLISLRAFGPLGALEVARLSIASGRSHVETRGWIRGLPDSIRFELDVRDLDVGSDDLRAALPDALPPTAHLGRVTGSGTFHGGIQWADGLTVSTDGRVDLRSEIGNLRGNLGLTSAPGRPLRYVVDADVRRLDLSRLTGDPSIASDLNGRVSIRVRGTTIREMDGGARLALGPSTLFDRQFSSMALDVAVQGGVVTGNASATGSGRLSTEGWVDLVQRRADITLTAVDFDLRTVFPDVPVTAFSGSAAVALAGTGLEDLVADASLDLVSASVILADSTWHLPDGRFGVSVRPAGTDGPRLQIESDAVAVEAAGDFDWVDLVAASTYWFERFEEVAVHDLLPTLSGPPRSPSSPLAPLREMAEQDLTLSVRSLRPEALRPWFEHLDPGTELRLSARLSSEAIAANLDVSSDSIGIGSTRFNSSTLSLALHARSQGDLLDGLELELDAATARMSIGTAAPAQNLIAARYDALRRSLDLSGHGIRLTDGLRVGVDAVVAILPDRYRLGGNFSLDAPEERWRAEGTEIDLFTDGFLFRAFDARRIAPAQADTPVLQLTGMASTRAVDTLHVRGQDLSLDEVLRIAGVVLPFDGRASADLLVTGVLGQPAVRGTSTVEDFTVWGDPAGRVVASSEIVSGREGFDVDIRVSPSADAGRILNDGRIAGSLRLPGRFPDGSRDPGYFDLSVDLTRLDLFIFDHLFPEIVDRSGGGASGTGTITGDWSFPLFDADLYVHDGHARVPVFNLDLAAAGRVTVDRAGIHLHAVDLRDKNGGRGTVDGGVLFNEYRYFSFDLAARLSEFEVIDVDRVRAGDLPFYGRIRASGSATLTGPIDNAFLRSPDAVTTPDSRIFIPVTAAAPVADAGFLTFTDADGQIPETQIRRSLIGERPEGERPFLEGLEMLLNVRAPSGSTVHLVFDPLIGDVISAVGSATLQLAIVEGEFRTYGTFEVERGDYLFTAGELFTRRFELDRGGTLEWTGDPIDATLNLPASYRTRASLAGLGLGAGDERQRVPFLVRLQVDGRVTAPLVELSLELDEAAGRSLAVAEALRRRLNEPDRQAEYATSVLLTNTFLLAPSDRPLTDAADDLLYTSLSELVSSRLNLFLNQALGADYIDVAVGVQQGTGIQDFDLTYGVALRLLDERLIIRGEGIYHQLENAPVSDALQGEVAVEMRLSDAVSIEVFYRREGDLLLGSGVASVPIGAYGAGVNYRAEFTNWRRVLQRLLALPPRERGAENDAQNGAPVVVTGS